VPSIERLLKDDLNLYRPGRSIGMMVLSPTRELAIQIADQAQQLLQYHPKAKGYSVACLYGGVKMQRDIRLLTGGISPHRLPTIVVSTPGRLLDHLEGNTRLGRNDRFADIMDDTKIVVLDETDRLWENHQRETKKILTFLARTEKRQTLLFSATIPGSLRRILQESLLKGQEVLDVNCLNHHGDCDQKWPQELTVAATNQQIQQSYVVLKNMSQYVAMLLTILRREQQTRPNDYKILVFFPSSRIVRFFFQFFTLGDIFLGTPNNRNSHDNVWEIHSRMSQSSRLRASNSFRNAKKGILFSTDVSARGLDYPDITLVVQMGAPSKTSIYIHRLGRTGRADKEGRGILVLLPFEAANNLITSNSGLLKIENELMAWCTSDGRQVQGDRTESSLSLFHTCWKDSESTRAKIKSGHTILTPSAEAAYKSFLAHYSAMAMFAKKGEKSESLIPAEILVQAEDFASAIGITKTPQLDNVFVSKKQNFGL
jgi:ATP-dependent RNA helicase MSS116, mitochondrial